MTRTITTAAELAALTPDECVLDRMGDVGVVRDGHIYYPETAPQTLERAARKYGPFLVLPLHDVQSVADALPHVTLEDTPDGITARASVVDDAVGRLTRSLAATEDDAIRRQLVALGWTPPGTAALHAPAPSADGDRIRRGAVGSAPDLDASAPSAVPEAAVEAAARAFHEAGGTCNGHRPLGLDACEDCADLALEAAHAALSAALPLLTAAPSATREATEDEVTEVVTEALTDAYRAERGMSRHTGLTAHDESVIRDQAAHVVNLADARFTITPKEDR